MSIVEVRAEITGTVWKIKVVPGDAVGEGDVLMIIESMKMEIPVIVEDKGVVKDILVKENEPVSEGKVVAILES